LSWSAKAWAKYRDGQRCAFLFRHGDSLHYSLLFGVTEG
jgi:hypothetical protein